MRKFTTIDLNQYYNNKGISYRDEYSHGDFTGFGSSYPAEDLPESNTLVQIHDVPFKFPVKEKGNVNNFDLYNQKVSVPIGIYSKIHILGAAENGSFEENLVLIGENEEQVVRFGLTDFKDEHPGYGEKIGFKCKGLHTSKAGYLSDIKPIIWQQSINVNLDGIIKSLNFVDNACLHIFAITVEEKR